MYIYIYSKPKRPPSPKKKNPPLPTSPGRHMYTQYHERKHHPTHPCPPPPVPCEKPMSPRVYVYICIDTYILLCILAM